MNSNDPTANTSTTKEVDTFKMEKTNVRQCLKHDVLYLQPPPNESDEGAHTRKRKMYLSIVRVRSRKAREVTCGQCNKRFPKHSLQSLAAEKGNNSYFENDKFCSGCVSVIIQNKKEQQSCEHMMHAFNVTHQMEKLPHETVSIRMKDLIEEYVKFPIEIISDDDFVSIIPLCLKVRKIIALPDAKKKRGGFYTGGYMDSGMMPTAEQSSRLLSLSEDKETPHDILWIDLGGDDFVTIFPADIMAKDILKIGLDETRRANDSIKNQRSGSAGGYTYPSTDSKSLTKVTQNEETLFIPAVEAVGLAIAYYNDDEDKDVFFNGVYNQMYMNRFDDKMKKEYIKNCSATRRMYVQQMITRLQSIVIGCHFGILDKATVLSGFNTILKDWNTNKLVLFFRREFFARPLEGVLLAWACTTGEMRNHQACAAHVDGNKSHVVESMVYFGRVNGEKDGAAVSVVEQMEDGYVFFPNNKIFTKMKCGKQFMHCSLKKTIHVADESRNKSNMSFVHGPV
jgi:hypothetical protein